MAHTSSHDAARVHTASRGISLRHIRPMWILVVLIILSIAILGLAAPSDFYRSLASSTPINSLFSNNSTTSALPAPADIKQDESLVTVYQYFQGFEQDAVWSGTSDPTRVPTGTDGITAKTGGFYAQAVTGNFTRWGGYNTVFPTGGFTTSMDIYLDVAGAFGNDTRFDYSSAANGQDGNHRRDYIFSGGFYNDTDATGTGPRFVFSASNNAPGFPKNPARSPYSITSSGWYTFKHRFYDNGGVLAVDLSIADSAGTTLTTWTLSDPSDVIATVVGGNRYGWIVNSGFATLPIDNSFMTTTGTTAVVDDDGQGTAADCNAPAPAHSTINAAIAAAAAGDTIKVCPGSYNEDVNVNKSLKIEGSGAAVTTVVGQIGGSEVSTFQVTAPNVEISGFTITRNGNTVAQWGSANGGGPTDPNTIGIGVNGQSFFGLKLHDNIITGNRNGVDINNSNGHIIRNNVIDNNRTGVIFRNQTDSVIFEENQVTNNWTLGVLFLDASGGTMSPRQTALGAKFNNNNISGNWYGQVVDRQTGGILPPPGTFLVKNFSGNWLGTTNPVITTADSAEPGYSALIPTAFGGTASAPGGTPHVAGPASANLLIDPMLQNGVDTDVETTPGRGTFGFQGGSTVGSVVTVKREAMNGWLFYNDVNDTIDNTLGSFVTGPGSAPSGNGSVQISVIGQERRNIATYQFAGTPLSSITTFAYSTYNPSAGNGGSPNRYGFANVNVDFNGSDTWQSRLVFLPPDNGTITQNSWQEWDMINGGNAMWRYSGATWPAGVGGGGEPGDSPKSWSQLLSQYPGIRFRMTDAHFGIRVGEPYLNGYTENIDSIKFGTAAGMTTFDFEPSNSLVVDDDGMASATDCDSTELASTSIAASVALATPGSTIRVCPGTYSTGGSTLNLNKAGLTVVGVGSAKPVIQTSGTNYLFLVTASGVTIDNLEIQKTDLGVPSPGHNIIGVQGSNFTAQNNLIYGPAQTLPWSTTARVSRAFEVSGGLTGILIQNNTIRHLRQPGYLNASSGSILNNNVSGTRGWVVDGAAALYNFSGNTWGEPQNEACDIALINATVLANYSPLLSLSTNNDNAFICSAGIGGPEGRATAYVDATPAAGNGSDNSNYTTIQEGINGALPGGTVQVAEGTYVEEIVINKQLNVLGPNANINPNTGTRVPEAIIMPATSNPIDPGFFGPVVVTLNATGVVFNGFTVDGDNPALTSGVVYNGADVNAEFGIYGPDQPIAGQATITNNIVKNIGEVGVYMSEFGFTGAHAVGTFDFNKIDNVPGHNYGYGIITSYNAKTNIRNNVITRTGVGIITENQNQPVTGTAPVISNNQVTAHSYGIRVNTQSGYTTNGWTVSNNTVNSYVESYARPTPVTRWNGIRLESLQGTIPLTVSSNVVTPNRTALQTAGYTAIDGIYVTNTSTVTPNISITGNTISNARRGISHTTPAVPNVSCNLLTNNDVGVFVGTDLGYGGVPSTATNGIIVNNNNITYNSTLGFQNDTAVVVNAENNFWGTSSGPGGAGPGTGNGVSTNVDFTPFLVSASGCASAPASVSISGTVSPSIANVQMTLAGTESAVTTTDANGHYTFANLPVGGDYLITPSLAGHVFEPINRNFSNVTASITNADFAGTTGTVARVIRVVSTQTIPGQSVVVPVELVSQGNENAIGFSLTYDPALLSNPVINPGSGAAGASLTTNTSTSGQIGILLGLPAGQAFPAGTRQLVTVTFATVPNAVPNTPVNFSNSPILMRVANPNADLLPATFVNGFVIFTQGLESDVAARFTGDGILNATDLTQIGRFIVGLETPNPSFNEFQRADSSPRVTRGDGFLDASDLTQSGRYAIGFEPPVAAAGPTVASVFPFAASQLRETNNGLWNGRTVRVIDSEANAGKEAEVRIVLDGIGNEAGLGFTLSYDPMVLADPIVELGNSMPGAMMAVNAEKSGRVTVVATYFDRTIAAGESGVFTIRFRVANDAPAGPTPLAMLDYAPMVNRVSTLDGPADDTVFMGGFVNILGGRSPEPVVSGLVTDADGLPLANARVTAISNTGTSRTSSVNPFGYYRLDGVTPGETLLIEVRSKGHKFAVRTVAVGNEAANINLIAQP